MLFDSVHIWRGNILKCRCKWGSNDFREHPNGFSRAWPHICFCSNLDIYMKFHTGNNCELGVWWTLTCCSKLFFKRKDLSHWEHLWGFSVWWILTCTVRWYFWEKAFPQLTHWNGFSALWIITCLCRELLWENDFKHWKQVNGFSPVWTLKWSFKLPDCANAFSQWTHL